MSLNLNDLRQRIGIAGRNAGDLNYYPYAVRDEAIDRLSARFARVTRCAKISTTVALTASGNSADFSALTGFLPGRIERARVVLDSNYTISTVREDLTITDAGSVSDRLACNASTGTPCMMGFTDAVTAKFYPAPKYDGTLSVTYAAMHATFTLGTRGAWSSGTTYYVGDVVSSGGNTYRSLVPNNVDAVSTTTSWENLGVGSLLAPSNIVSVIPDALVVEMIGTGGPPALQAVDPEHQAFVGAAWANYLAFEQACMGIGSISGNVSHARVESLRGGRY